MFSVQNERGVFFLKNNLHIYFIVEFLALELHRNEMSS